MTGYQQTGTEAPRAGVVAAPDAITSTDAAGAAPDAAEFDALRADVVALRGTVASLITTLQTANLVD